MQEAATANGRNMYYEGQHDAEEPADTAARLALVKERDALVQRVCELRQVLQMVDDNHRVDAGEKRKAWNGRFVVEQVRQALGTQPEMLRAAPHVKTAAEMRADAAHDTSCVGAFARARPGA